MDLPSALVINMTLKPGAVYYFKHELFDNTPHYFVVLNLEKDTTENLLLVCATSRIDARTNFVKQRNLDLKTLVLVSSKDCDFLKLDSVFDCNNLYEYPLRALRDKIDTGNARVCSSVDTELLNKLREGVRASKLVARRIKNKLVSN